jgi:hypothetical protein
MWESHAIKTTCTCHMSMRHMSLLYMYCMKFPTNRFVENFCPVRNINYSISINSFKLSWPIYLRKKFSFKLDWENLFSINLLN